MKSDQKCITPRCRKRAQYCEDHGPITVNLDRVWREERSKRRKQRAEDLKLTRRVAELLKGMIDAL